MPKKKKASWTDIIANTALGDDMVIAVGDDSLTLGELREMNTESGGEVAAQLDSREKALQRDQASLIAAQTELANMFQKLSDITGYEPNELLQNPALLDGFRGDGEGDGKRKVGKRAAAAAAAAATGLDEDDVLLQPAIKKIQELKDNDIKGLKGEINNLRQALGIALKVNLDDYYERVYNSYTFPSDDVMKKHKFQKPALEQVLKFATDNGLKDKSGRLGVQRALDTLTDSIRRKEEIEAAEQRGEKRAQESQRMATVQPPGNRGPRALQPEFKRKDGTTKDIGEVLAQAAEDTDLWGSALGVTGDSSAA